MSGIGETYSSIGLDEKISADVADQTRAGKLRRIDYKAVVKDLKWRI